MDKQKVTLEVDPTGTEVQKRPGNDNLQGQKVTCQQDTVIKWRGGQCLSASATESELCPGERKLACSLAIAEGCSGCAVEGPGGPGGPQE